MEKHTKERDKYASGVRFRAEKLYRKSVFIWDDQGRLQQFVIAFLFLELVKNMLF